MTTPPEPFLGVLMLQTRFPRPPGDVGHPASWRLPVRWRVVEGASPQRVVREGDVALLQPFIDAARELVAEGATAITTSCGFLVQFQAPLLAALPVPVWTSSLLKLTELQRPGVLTVDSASLGAAHLRAAGADPDTPIEGLEAGCALQNTLLNDLVELDEYQACADIVAAVRRLISRAPQIDSIVLECTNMPPYAAAVQRAAGRPVHDLLTVVHERWRAMRCDGDFQRD